MTKLTYDRCRAVVVTKDDKRFMTPWRRYKPMSELGPDEPSPVFRSIKDAERLAERKKLNVRRIDGQFHHRAKADAVS